MVSQIDMLLLSGDANHCCTPDHFQHRYLSLRHYSPASLYSAPQEHSYGLTSFVRRQTIDHAAAFICALCIVIHRVIRNSADARDHCWQQTHYHHSC